jgi:ribonuclease III
MASWREQIAQWMRGRRPAPRVLPPDLDAAARLLAFQERTGIAFHDRELLRRSLTHRSYLGGEDAHGADSNERLEFLGDAVLELVVIDHLYQQFPEAREGDLTQKKSLLVSRSVLAERAERLGLGEFILLSAAERGAGGGERRSILADAFEAVLGAIYLDQGLDGARPFVDRWLLRESDRILGNTQMRNFKSILQERIQARIRLHPRYRVVSEMGPDHEKCFTIEVLVRGTVLGRGSGSNKKEAEQQAAREALRSGELTRWLQEEGPGA